MAYRLVRSSSQRIERTSGTIVDFSSDATITFYLYFDDLSDWIAAYGILGLRSGTSQSVNLSATGLFTVDIKLYLEVFGSATDSSVGSTTLSTGQWYKVQVYRDGDDVVAVLDDVEECRVTAPVTVSTNEIYYGTRCDQNNNHAPHSSAYMDGRVTYQKEFDALLLEAARKQELLQISPVNLLDLVDFWPSTATGLRAEGYFKGIDWTEVGSPTYVDNPVLSWGNETQLVGKSAATGGDQTVSPSGIASGEAFGTATVTPGEVTVSPSGIASGEAFGTATVTPGEVTVSPSGIASAEAFGTATVTPGEVTLTPTGIASAEAFGTAVVTVGDITLSPTGISSAEAFGTAVITPGEVTVSPTGIASLEAFGTPTVFDSAVQTITVVGIASAEQFGTPRLLRPPTGTAIVVA